MLVSLLLFCSSALLFFCPSPLPGAVSGREDRLKSDHPYRPDCLFCKIIRGAVPSSRLLETDDAVAFLDIHPVNKGHVLLVPKAHHANLAELDDAHSAHLGALLPRLCRAIQAATKAEGFNVIVNNGAAAGQTIDHGHWHIIPRWTADPVHWPWPHAEYVGEELEQMRSRIESALKTG
jgi:histidine triad (HIT) family protein